MRNFIILINQKFMHFNLKNIFSKSKYFHSLQTQYELVVGRTQSNTF